MQHNTHCTGTNSTRLSCFRSGKAERRDGVFGVCLRPLRVLCTRVPGRRPFQCPRFWRSGPSCEPPSHCTSAHEDLECSSPIISLYSHTLTLLLSDDPERRTPQYTTRCPRYPGTRTRIGCSHVGLDVGHFRVAACGGLLSKSQSMGGPIKGEASGVIGPLLRDEVRLPSMFVVCYIFRLRKGKTYV